MHDTHTDTHTHTCTFLDRQETPEKCFITRISLLSVKNIANWINLSWQKILIHWTTKILLRIRMMQIKMAIMNTICSWVSIGFVSLPPWIAQWWFYFALFDMVVAEKGFFMTSPNLSFPCWKKTVMQRWVPSIFQGTHLVRLRRIHLNIPKTLDKWPIGNIRTWNKFLTSRNVLLDSILLSLCTPLTQDNL